MDPRPVSASVNLRLGSNEADICLVLQRVLASLQHQSVLARCARGGSPSLARLHSSASFGASVSYAWPSCIRSSPPGPSQAEQLVDVLTVMRQTSSYCVAKVPLNVVRGCETRMCRCSFRTIDHAFAVIHGEIVRSVG